MKTQKSIETIVYIVLLWLAIISTGIAFAFLFKGEQSMIRLLIILPFVSMGNRVTALILERYSDNNLN